MKLKGVINIMVDLFPMGGPQCLTLWLLLWDFVLKRIFSLLLAKIRFGVRIILVVVSNFLIFPTIDNWIGLHLSQTPLDRCMLCLVLEFLLGMLCSHCLGKFACIFDANCIVITFHQHEYL